MAVAAQMEKRMTKEKAVSLVQQQLNGMSSLHLGAMLAEADKLRRTGEDEFTRNVGENLYGQVLAAFAWQISVSRGEI